MIEFLLPIVFVTLIVLWKREYFTKLRNPTDGFLDEIVESRQLKVKEKIIHKTEEKRFSDELCDFHPKSWLKKYRQTSFVYLCKMGLFYSVLGTIAAYSVYGIQFFVFGYEEPVVPVSLLSSILAGPVEETIFFGIPFALSGNHFVVIATGILWSSIHLFNASEVGMEGFSNATFAFALPHIFFSLRTWKSGKGWFAIFFHSAWNATVVSLSMAIGEIPLQIFDATYAGMLDGGLIIISLILMAITYPLYKWRLKREARKELNEC